MLKAVLLCLINSKGNIKVNKYDLKRDLKKIFYLSKISLTILFFFLVFCLVFIFPIYYFSKNFTNIYTIIVLLLIAVLLLFMLMKKLIKVWNKYKELKPFLLHFFLYYLNPIILLIFFILAETVAFRVLYQLIPFLFATVAITLMNLIFIFFIILVRKLYFNSKQYLAGKIKIC